MWDSGNVWGGYMLFEDAAHYWYNCSVFVMQRVVNNNSEQ